MITLHRSSIGILLFFLFSFLSVSSTPVGASDTKVNAYQGELTAPTNKRRVLAIYQGDTPVKKYKIAALEALPLYETVLPALYTGEDGAYQGILLDDLLKDAGITDYKKLRMSALDGYVIEFTRTPLVGKKGFIATRFKGMEMPVAEKGYTRLLLPAEVDWKNPVNTNTSIWIWNLNKITILE